MNTEQEKEYKAQPAAIIERENITIESVFVPWSQSRNKSEKHKSLNWIVTLKRNGRDILTTDYGAGIGHCPAYKNPPRFPQNANNTPRAGVAGKVDTWAQNRVIAFECENGVEGIFLHPDMVRQASPRRAIEPDAESVLYSLIMDSYVIDYSSFEDWAQNFGYDMDSRSAEKSYQACLDIALKLRSGLGDSLINELREAFQDY